MESTLTQKKSPKMIQNKKNPKLDGASTVSPFQIFKREIVKDKVALVSLVILVGITLLVTVIPFFINEAELTHVDLFNTNQPPSADFWLGTNHSGQSVLGILVLGARNSLTLTIMVTLLTGSFGILFGLVSGYFGGQTDNVLMRVVDFFNILPTLVIIIVFVTLVDWSYLNMMFILSAFAWTGIARLIRSRALQERELEYVQASKTLGTPHMKIMFREVFPNILPLVIVQMTLSLSANVGLETGLSFLGFGFPFETPSLGGMIRTATNPTVMQNRWWVWLPALVLVFVLMLSINNLGQCLKRATDARQRRG
ncbi:MAG: ABC transporter permease [Turicibacter sp.]|nr:ABC transporter permease [Turicibacter sp.]